MRQIFLGIVSVTLLTNCSSITRVSPSPLPPEEVLRRAADATALLESAEYAAEGSFGTVSAIRSTTGTFRMDGRLQNAGKQITFLADVTAQVEGHSSLPSAIAGAAEVVVISENEVYLNIRALSSQPEGTVFRPELVERFAGRWWLLPAGVSPAGAMSITQDPRMLQAQSKVVTVTRDRGIETLDGRDTYHYDVSLDTARLLAYISAHSAERGDTFDAESMLQYIQGIVATGELWIDAQTYFLQKIQWNIASVPYGDGGMLSLAAVIALRSHNSAPAIASPKEFTSFTPAALYAPPSNSRSMGGDTVGGPDDLTDEDISNFIRQMNAL